MPLASRSHRAETIKFLTLDEIKRLFSVIRNKRDKALFLLAYRHGLRASEVGLLHKQQALLHESVKCFVHNNL